MEYFVLVEFYLAYVNLTLRLLKLLQKEANFKFQCVYDRKL